MTYWLTSTLALTQAYHTEKQYTLRQENILTLL